MKKNYHLHILSLFILFIFVGCDYSTQKSDLEEMLKDETRMKESQVYNCDYLREPLPGDRPVVFASGIISTAADEYAFEISMSGKEMMFIRNNKVMFVTKNNSGDWGKPYVAPFSGEYIDDESFFSPDGKKVFFVSRRPAAGSSFPVNLWMSYKKDSTWAQPGVLKELIHIKNMHAPSIAASGNIYDDGITFFQWTGNKYIEAKKIDSLKGMYPFIAPDESYIIYSSRKPDKYDSDLYISFQNYNGTWCKGIPLGNEINSTYNEGNSFVTADGKYLFFSRKFDVYWVSAKFIEEIKLNKQGNIHTQ
jgi:hypothetical protein